MLPYPFSAFLPTQSVIGKYVKNQENSGKIKKFWTSRFSRTRNDINILV